MRSQPKSLGLAPAPFLKSPLLTRFEAYWKVRTPKSKQPCKACKGTNGVLGMPSAIKHLPGVQIGMQPMLQLSHSTGGSLSMDGLVRPVQERRTQTAFHVFGMELLASLDLSDTNRFFDTFFRLPRWVWQDKSAAGGFGCPQALAAACVCAQGHMQFCMYMCACMGICTFSSLIRVCVCRGVDV